MCECSAIWLLTHQQPSFSLLKCPPPRFRTPALFTHWALQGGTIDICHLQHKDASLVWHIQQLPNKWDFCGELFYKGLVTGCSLYIINSPIEAQTEPVSHNYCKTNDNCASEQVNLVRNVSGCQHNSKAQQLAPLPSFKHTLSGGLGSVTLSASSLSLTLSPPFLYPPDHTELQLTVNTLAGLLTLHFLWVCCSLPFLF